MENVCSGYEYDPTEWEMIKKICVKVFFLSNRTYEYNHGQQGRLNFVLLLLKNLRLRPDNIHM